MSDRRVRARRRLQRERLAAAVRRAPRGQTRGGTVDSAPGSEEAAAAAAARGSLEKNQRLRPSVRGVGSLIVALLAFVVAYSAGRTEALVVAGAALLLVLIGLLVARIRRPRLDVVRLFSPPVVSAGTSVQVTLRIQNKGAGPSPHLVWNDAIPWQQAAEPNDLPPIGGSASQRRLVTAHYELHPPRRGLYQIGPLVVEHEDPFGMAHSTIAVGLPDRLVVVPAIVDLPAGGPTLADGEGSANLVQRRVTGNDDDLTTREYRTGDALRRVHWRASARRGELMVRQEEHRSHPDAHIILDTRLAGYPDADIDDADVWHPTFSSDAFEWTVRMLASLGVHLDTSGFQVTIEETAAPQVDQLGERWDGTRREGFLTSLAGVTLVDAGPERLQRAPVVDASGPIFAVLGDPEELTIDWLIRRRHGGDAAIAFLVDPRPAAVKRLTEAGWLCVPVQVWDQPAAAWKAASSEAGYLRGAH
ncbi:MAG TPA: DUF58 domain-containing protein [Pseudolysinimonas sp.]|jgi:hypothetical protein